jgi:site-specific DNA-methyltransferase (adenine-specific)
MNKVGFSSEKMNWRTPPSVFNWFDKTLRFTLDAAASPDNALCVDYLTQAFEQDWGTHQSVWINPPYGRYGMERWLEKAHAEAQKGKVVACLIFARTDTRWWHD